MAFEVWSIQGTMTLKGAAQVESQLKNISQRASDLGAKLQSAGRSMQLAGQSMQAVGQQMSIFITAPLLAAAGAALKFAGDFDKAMRSVNVMLGASTEEVSQYKEEILALSNETAVSATDITSAFYQIVSAGFRGADAIDILTVAIKGSVGGAAESLTTTQALTKAMNIFALEGVDGASRAMDVFFGIVDTGLLTFEEMANSFPRAASNAAGLGVSIEETGAALGTLTKFTGSTEQAATALDATLRMLISPSEAMLAQFSEWGVSTGPEAIEKFGGLTGVLKELQSVAQGDVTVIKALFQSDEALKGALPLLTYAFEDFNEAVETVTGSTGRAGEAFTEMAEGTGFELAQMTTTLKNDMISLGEAISGTVIPWAQSLIDKIQVAVDWFKNLDEGTQKTLLTLTGIAVVLGPAILYLGMLLQALGSIVAFLPKFASMITTTLLPALVKGIAGFVAFFTAMGPAGWIILGGMAVALAAGIALFANWIGSMGTPKLGGGSDMVSTSYGMVTREEFKAGYDEETGTYTPTSGVASYGGGGPIDQDTLLFGLESRRVYAKAHAGERVTSKEQTPIAITINMPGPYYIRKEADMDLLLQKMDGKFRSTLRAAGVAT